MEFDIAMDKDFGVKLLLVLSIFSQHQPSYSFDLHQDYQTVSSIARIIYAANFTKEYAREIHQLYSTNNVRIIHDILSIDGHIIKLLREITYASKKIDKIAHLEYALQTISEAIWNVEYEYDRFMAFFELKQSGVGRSRTIEEFAKFMVGPIGLSSHLEYINSKFVQSHFASNEESTTPKILLTYLQDYEYLCDKKKSMSMVISELFDIIVKAEIKSLIIMTFSFDILKKYQIGQYDYESDLHLMGTLADKRVERTREILLEAASKASRAIWSCDPREHTERAILGLGTQQNNHIYFNINPVSTNVAYYKVMTGARFNLRKIVINNEEAEEVYLEIQQGTLLSDGRIDPSTLEWKNNLKAKNPKRYRLEINKSRVKLMAQDSGSTSIFLTGLQLKIEDGNFVTLQTFGIQDPWKNEGEIKSVDIFDYTLPRDVAEQGNNPNLRDLVSNLDRSQRYSYITSFGQKVYTIPQNRLLVGEKSSNKCKNQQSKNLTRYFGQFAFQESPSNQKRSEKQSVIVPFIDIQEVVTDPPSPLSGAALYHKGSLGCENYLAIELRTRSHENSTLMTRG
ncbi:hypothetical protein QAD02_006665 [Eretmocerus hayati]|uniref:Uncharacterized protein n=1 Tax=Eretmocerus hayati TaxID=131215 RepID=A0ACC2N1K0_9HYME|nr:hypothetical protein QAD02_006665 [Eretmocerus hayati]